MKIEDYPFRFQGVSPLNKLYQPQLSVEAMLDDLDFSFLDLLTTVAENSDQQAAIVDHARQAQKAAETSHTTEPAGRPNLKLVEKTDKYAPLPVEDLAAQVREDMKLLQDDLTPGDLQYLKQAVIPGLPILMGSVPIESVFPSDGAGGLSYKGHDISPKLAELISKGYRTGHPIRVDLDANSSVVLKIHKGQVSAEFVSGDKNAALVMQQELDNLRNRMAAKNLPVGTLDSRYRDPERQQQSPRDERNDENS